jgi:hypothetical protein
MRSRRRQQGQRKKSRRAGGRKTVIDGPGVFLPRPRNLPQLQTGPRGTSSRNSLVVQHVVNRFEAGSFPAQSPRGGNS